MKKNNHKYNDDGILYGVMKFLIFILVIVISSVIILLLTRLSNITVDGSSHYSNEEIKDILITKEIDKNNSEVEVS